MMPTSLTDDEIKKAQALLPEFATFAIFREKLYAVHPSHPIMVFDGRRGWRPVKPGDGVAKLDDSTSPRMGMLIRPFASLLSRLRN